MNKYKRSTVVDLAVDIDEGLKEVVRSFLETLEYVQALYHIENTQDFSLTLENTIFQQIVKTLKRAGRYLSGEEKYDFEKKVGLISQGIYDLFSITLKHSKKDYIDLIIGKIFSSGKNNRRCYAGAVGVVNRSFNNLIQAYDEKLDFFLEKLPVPDEYKGSSIKGNKPLMRCVDVFSLAGELNIQHKPICVFFSGGSSENLSALSRMIVFINVYVERFKLISKEIARIFLLDYSAIENLASEDIARLLLLWLRGHDIGHFYGIDSLCRRMPELDKVYLILHELKSDLVALYNLRYLADDLLKGDLLIKAYVTSIAEMFRYIRRGGFYNHCDTASAFLAYSYFRENGSIKFDSKEKKFRVDFSKLEADIENLTKKIFRIFAEGDVTEGTGLVNRWGNIKELGEKNLPDELRMITEDTDIPHYIDFNFITKDRVLLGLY